VLIGASALVALVLAGLQLSGIDWAAGAIRLGTGAAVVAGLIILVTAVRAAVNRGQASEKGLVTRYLAPVLGVVLLLALAGSAFGLQAPIHGAQAFVLDHSQDYQRAIDEYTLGGEQAPGSSNLARVYNDWGEQLTKQQQFGTAVDKFNTVLSTYAGATGEVARAQKDSVTAYLGWGKQASAQLKYQDATQHFDTLLQQSFCDAACQTQASALDATAYYNLAQAALSAGQYAAAVNAFHALSSRFASAPEAGQIHASFATALLGLGKQQAKQSPCPDAIATYHELTTNYSDTPEGQQAVADLAAPQPVMGRFTSAIPSGATVFLTRGLRSDSTGDQVVAILNASPHAPVSSDGSFAFAPLAQGQYDLAWAFPLGSDSAEYVTVFNLDGTPFLVASVGPLCAFTFGAIQAPFIPTSAPLTAAARATYSMVLRRGRVDALAGR
jgi:tetratricopeptide (TPR) repeat protein